MTADRDVRWDGFVNADALIRWPNLHAGALAAIAEAPAGVLVHCGRGHNRTGIVALLLLALAGATHEAIVADYLRSGDRLAGRGCLLTAAGMSAAQLAALRRRLAGRPS